MPGIFKQIESCFIKTYIAVRECLCAVRSVNKIHDNGS